MTIVKEAHFVSISAHPRLDACSQTVANQDKHLVIAFSIRGENATSFCKDLSSEFNNWQIDNPEQLHHKILDLLSFIRQKKLEIEFSLSLLINEQIIFASYSAEVILKRNGQVKKILESTKEPKIVVGNFKNNDQIILINKSAAAIEDQILEMLIQGVSLEKLVSETSLIQQKYEDLNESLAFLTYKTKINEEITAKKKTIEFSNLLKKAAILLKIIKNNLKKFPPLLNKIVTTIKKQNRKKMIILIIIFFSISLILFSGVAIAGKQNKKTTENIEKKIEEINQNTANINQLILEQPLMARETAQKNLDALESLKKEKNNKATLKLIDEEINKLKNLINEISGSNSLDRLSIAYDLEDFLASKIEVFEKQIFLLETNGQEILHIKEDQNREKIALENNQKIKGFTVSENKLYALSNGLKMLDLGKNERTFTDIKAEGESDKTGELLSSFGPYLYLLNKDKRNIYRYYYNEDKLSEPIGWLVDKQGVNFDDISDLMIDGDVWMGMKNGNLLKFSKGYSADFSIKGLNQLPNSSILISSNENSNRLAILEKQSKRLLIVTKDGQLINEIKSNELATVSSISFNNDGNKIYAVSGSVIYEVEI